MIKGLEAENKLLKLKESKFKLALDNLLERSEKQRKEIHDLKTRINELEETNSYSKHQIANLKAESKRKCREMIRMQMKLDMLRVGSAEGTAWIGTPNSPKKILTT